MAGLLALTLVALLALTAGPASATVARQYESSITEAGGAGLGTPQGLAVDSAGNLYLADGAAHAVDKFDAAGDPVVAWGTNGQLTEVPTTPSATPLSSPFGLAVDEADNLWLTDTGLGSVFKLSPAGAFEAQGEGPEPGGGFPFGGEFIQSLTWNDNAAELFVADSALDQIFGLEADGSYSGTALEEGLGAGASFIRAATDNSGGATDGDIYVATGSTVVRIDPSGAAANFAESGVLSYVSENTLTGTPEGPFGNLVPSGRGALAVDSAGDIYVADTEHNRVDEFAPSGQYLGKLTGTPTGPAGANVSFGEIAALGVGAATGKLYVADATAAKVDVFGPPVVIPDVTTLPPTDLTTTSATLNGEVDPAGLGVEECAFEYGETIAYGEVAPCAESSAVIGEGNAFVPVHADVANLTPGIEYHYRLIAKNENGTNKESSDERFITGATIDATSASEVTATTAVLETEINPRGLPTTYSFQYGPTTAYGSETPMPPAPLGAGEADVTRAAAVSGLEPSTVYHFRVLATNSLGTVESPDHTFTTQPATTASLLPDNRGWELVSPPDKQGIPLAPISREGGLIQAAADGHAITYFGRGSIVSEPAGDRSSVNSQDLSLHTGTGWSTADITTPHQAPVGAAPGHESEYRLFSPDLSLAAVEPFGATRLSPQATEKTPYLRASEGSYLPLVTEANTPPGTHFGGVEQSPEAFIAGVELVTATSDLSHVLLESPTPLVAGFTPSGAGIYEWSAGTLTATSFVPPGSTTVCGVSCVPNAVSASVGSRGTQVRNAISAGGSRVVFEAGGLYLRDLVRGETLLLDAPQGAAVGEAGGATFQFASAGGSRVFFTDAEPLTESSTAASGKPDLYMCEIEIEAAHLACDLTDLTANTIDPSEPAAVQGAVIGAAGDGSSIYFVADAALTEGEGAIHGDCAGLQPTPGQTCNLYRYDVETAGLRLAAVLSGADYPDWAAESAGTKLQGLTARVSPDGNWLAFMSQRPLTGYDNRDAASSERDEEVFLYDAADGRLLCASCNPTGARPAGRQGPPNVPYALVDGQPNWEGRWYAANVPGWTNVDNQGALYQSRYLSDSGRLFFNSSDALVPTDTNGTEDVYQYEPPGVGSCTEGNIAFVPRNGGCVALISSGTSASESAFMDADERGENVFFLTASRLTAKDEDKALDIYDASVGGGEAAPIKPVECSGDACQQPAVPPAHPTPGTLLVNGPENVKQCPKGKKLQKGKCVKKKQKAKKHKKGKKNNSSKKKGGGKKQKRAAGHNRGGHK